MDEREKSELKSKIQGEIESLKKDIEHLEENTQPIAPDVAIGRLTRMDAIVNKGVNEAALSDARNKLTRLENALGDLDQPDSSYGICKICGEPIAPARLEFMPETTTCVNCSGA